MRCGNAGVSTCTSEIRTRTGLVLELDQTERGTLTSQRPIRRRSALQAPRSTVTLSGGEGKGGKHDI